MPRHMLPAVLLLAALLACSPQRGTRHRDTEEFAAAQELRRSGNLAAASDRWRRILIADPDAVDAAVELSATERRRGNAEEAVHIMTQMNARFPDNPAVLSQLGHALTDLGRTGDAVTVFDRLIALEPQNPQGYSGKGVAFDRAGNHLAAQDIYQEGLKRSPDSLTLHNNLAMSLILNEEPGKAAAMLETLHAQHPGNRTVLQNLALAYGLKGETARALELNLKDLDAAQAQENLRFYRSYLRQKRKARKSGTPPGGVGFTETPAAIRSAAERKVAPPRKKDETGETPGEEDAKREEKEERNTAAPVQPPAAPAAPRGTPLPTRSAASPRPDYPGQR